MGMPPGYDSWKTDSGREGYRESIECDNCGEPEDEPHAVGCYRNQHYFRIDTLAHAVAEHLRKERYRLQETLSGKHWDRLHELIDEISDNLSHVEYSEPEKPEDMGHE